MAIVATPDGTLINVTAPSGGWEDRSIGELLANYALGAVRRREIKVLINSQMTSWAVCDIPSEGIPNLSATFELGVPIIGHALIISPSDSRAEQ